MTALGAWASSLGAGIREFAGARSVCVPPIVFRFSHPARRALATRRAGAKVWEAYPPDCSESGTWEVHIHPRETRPHTIVVAALAGLASAVAGRGVAFGAEYRASAGRLGLAPGPSGRKRGGVSWRNAVADARASEAIDALAHSLGALPIGALDASKAQRQYPDRNFRKAVCPTCGSTNARLSKKAFEERIFLCGGLREAPHAPAVVTLGQDTEEAEAAGPAGRGERLLRPMNRGNAR